MESAPHIPDHELLRCIGRGAYGEVWLARNVTGAYRAVKIVYRRSFDHERPYQREFSGIQKYEPVSRSHETQVNILHVGRNDADGYFFYIMELADDRFTGQNVNPDSYEPWTLRSHLSQNGRSPIEQCLDIAIHLASALGHIHENGLVHRDVKPSNIIFVNRVPKLADIGLVAATDAARSFVGTEGYIPPEGPGSPQADIYSLGKVLYEISTGRNRLDFPELPTLLKDLPEREALVQFNEVVLKACEEDPKRRYQTAATMLADLWKLKSREPIRPIRSELVSIKAVLSILTVMVIAGILTLSLLLGKRMLFPHRLATGKLTREALFEKQFHFASRGPRDNSFSYYGFLELQRDGKLSGSGVNPDQTFWSIDEQGRLIFKSQDGRVSTIFTNATHHDGKWHFSGPFQFWRGSMNSLEEVSPQTVANEMWIKPLSLATSELQNSHDTGSANFVSNILASFNQPGGMADNARVLDMERLKVRVRDLVRNGAMESAAILNRAQVDAFWPDSPQQPPKPSHKTSGAPGPGGLVLYLPFNKPADADGIVHDESGAGNDGKVFGAQWVPDARFGGAYQFRLTNFNDRIVIPNSDTLNPQHITLMAWIKSSGPSGFWRRIIDKDCWHGYCLSLAGSGRDEGKVCFEGQIPWNPVGHVLDDNQWHHIAVTYDGHAEHCYIDGAENGGRRVMYSRSLKPDDWDLCIGNSVPDFGDELLSFNGLITEVRIYNRALSPEEIESLATTQTGMKVISPVLALPETFKQRLVLWFSFDSAETGGHITDQSGQGNDGRATGTQWTPGGKFSGALVFSPTDSHIRVPNSDALNPAQFTLSVWIKSTYADHFYRRIFDKGLFHNSFDLTIVGDYYKLNPPTKYRGFVQFEVANTRALQSTHSIADGQWHQIIATYDEHRHKRLFVDGQLEDQTYNPGPSPGNNLDLMIGGFTDPDPNYDDPHASFDGSLAEVMMFNRALSSVEVWQLYDFQKAGFPTAAEASP